MRFSEHFELPGNQAQYDFIDVPLGTDIRVFIDPYAITITRTPWSQQCHQIVTDFFQKVLDALRADDRAAARALLCEMHEDNRPRTGYSEGQPQGTAWGPEKADLFIDRLISSEAFASGLIEDIQDGALFVDKIGRDTVSDAMVNILHEQLALYTREQCELFGVPLESREKMLTWRPGEGWVTIEVDLPIAHGESILLLPRSIVRKDLSLKPDRFLNDFLDEYVDRGNLSATRALEEALQEKVPTRGKNDKKRTHRGKVRDKLKEKGTKKDVMARITRHFPDALKGFKERARKNRPALTPYELEELQGDRHSIDIANIVHEMRSAAENADDVWRAVVGVVGGLVAGFHPILQHPQPVDGVKKGVAGIIMANTATSGVFWQARQVERGVTRPNLLVLTASKPIDDLLISEFGYEKMLTDADAGAALLVGPSLASETRGRRAELTKRGLMVATIEEVADVVEMDAEPEVAAEVFAKLVEA